MMNKNLLKSLSINIGLITALSFGTFKEVEVLITASYVYIYILLVISVVMLLGVLLGFTNDVVRILNEGKSMPSWLNTSFDLIILMLLIIDGGMFTAVLWSFSIALYYSLMKEDIK